MGRYSRRWLTVLGAGLLAIGTTVHGRQDRLLCLAMPGRFGVTPEATEEVLNAQASRGYRLVSLNEVQIWERAAAGPAPEYRIVTEPVLRIGTESGVREANARFRNGLNAIAQDGFRVHPGAFAFLLSAAWGTSRGVALMERRPDSPLTCTYDVVHVSDIRDEGKVLAPGSVPLPLPFRGVLTESCGPPDMPPPGPTLRSLGASLSSFRSEETVDRRLIELLSVSSDEGCRLVGWWSAAFIVLCDSSVVGTPTSYRIVRFAAQAQLTAAAAEGYCLAPSWESGTHGERALLLEKRTPAAERCEYRLVVAEGSRLVDLVTGGLLQGFLPTWRTSFILFQSKLTQPRAVPWGALLERRRPAA